MNLGKIFSAVLYALLFGVIGAAFLLIASFLPAIYCPSHYEKYQYAYDGRWWIFCLGWFHLGSGIRAIYQKPDFFVAIFTLIIAIFTLRLWWDGKESSRRGLRAYIHFNPDSIVINGLSVIQNMVTEAHLVKIGRLTTATLPNPPTNNSFFYQIEIKNYGKTPAHNIIFGNATFFVDKFPNGDKKRLKPPTRKEILSRRKEVEVFTHAISLGPTMRAVYPIIPPSNSKIEGLEKFDSAGHALYVIGAVYYKDAFGISRSTKFCFGHTIDSSTSQLGTRVIASPQGNDAT